MARALFATLAALLLVGVQSISIIESRAVNEEYYVGHAKRMLAIEASGNVIGAGSVADGLSLLSTAILNGERLIDNPAERVRLLLAVCAVLLLIGAGYATSRLRSNNRKLKRSNTELAEANSTLEQLVETRTGALSRARDDLKESQAQLVQAEKMSSLGERRVDAETGQGTSVTVDFPIGASHVAVDEDLPVLHNESTMENGEAPEVPDPVDESLPTLHYDLTAKIRSHG